MSNKHEGYTLEAALLEAVDDISDEFREEMSKKLLKVFAGFLMQINAAKEDIANGTVELEDLLCSAEDTRDDADE